MDNEKIGSLIRILRKERGLTQAQLAQQMHLSDKTISKWERGNCPDISLLPELSSIFDVSLDELLTGELSANRVAQGNMRKLKFFVCPQCHNLITTMATARVSCCGKKLQALQQQKAQSDQKLKVETIENDYYITSDHPMTKDHSITFVALLTGDALLLKKQYPEWDLQVRLPRLGRGLLVWHCTTHGLMYQLI